MAKPVVGILMGSDSDIPVMEAAAAMLKEFGIEFEMTIASAHRTPKRVLEYSAGAEKRGIKVIIAGAGWAAHLAGVIASQTTLPVIGVPIDSSPLNGMDALLSTVQMPGGIPVASMSLGKSGAKNAGIFAAQIIGLSDVKVANRLKVYRVEMERAVEEKAKQLEASYATKESVPTKPVQRPRLEPRIAAKRATEEPVPVIEQPAAAAEESTNDSVAPAKKKPRRRRWKKKPTVNPAAPQEPGA